MANYETLHVVFDGPPGPQSGRFIEVETPDGRGVNAGEWHEREDGYWELRITRPAPKADSALVERIKGPLSDNSELAFILGRPGFMFIRECQLFRSLGHEIPKRAEDEQAFWVHRMLGFWVKYGEQWRDAFHADIKAHIEQARALKGGVDE